jgi:hypothetical protein
MGALLAPAGFDARPQGRQSRAETQTELPPLRVVSRCENGRPIFYYADPYSCACVYVGDLEAYARYEQLTLAKDVSETPRGFVGVHGGGEPGAFSEEGESAPRSRSRPPRCRGTHCTFTAGRVSATAGTGRPRVHPTPATPRDLKHADGSRRTQASRTPEAP